MSSKLLIFLFFYVFDRIIIHLRFILIALRRDCKIEYGIATYLDFRIR